MSWVLQDLLRTGWSSSKKAQCFAFFGSWICLFMATCLWFFFVAWWILWGFLVLFFVPCCGGCCNLAMVVSKLSKECKGGSSDDDKVQFKFQRVTLPGDNRESVPTDLEMTCTLMMMVEKEDVVFVAWSTIEIGFIPELNLQVLWLAQTPLPRMSYAFLDSKVNNCQHWVVLYLASQLGFGDWNLGLSGSCSRTFWPFPQQLSQRKSLEETCLIFRRLPARSLSQTMWRRCIRRCALPQTWNCPLLTRLMPGNSGQNVLFSLGLLQAILVSGPKTRTNWW